MRSASSLDTLGVRARGPAMGGCYEAIRLRARVVIGVGAKLHEQESAAVRQQCDVVERQLLAAKKVHQHAIEPLEPNRFVIQDLRHRVSRGECIRKAKHHKLPVLGALHQAHRCFEDSYACGFRADQCARDVKSILRQQLIEVVAGDPARDVRKVL